MSNASEDVVRHARSLRMIGAGLIVVGVITASISAAGFLLAAVGLVIVTAAQYLTGRYE